MESLNSTDSFGCVLNPEIDRLKESDNYEPTKKKEKKSDLKMKRKQITKLNKKLRQLLVLPWAKERSRSTETRSTLKKQNRPIISLTISGNG